VDGSPHDTPDSGRTRVVIEHVSPEINAGAYPVKRTAGGEVAVEASIFTDGHDRIAAVLKYRRQGDADWAEVRMRPLGNDRWTAAFEVPEVGIYEYTLEAWIDRFTTWQEDLKKRVAAGQDVAVELDIGAVLVREVADASGHETPHLAAMADMLATDGSMQSRIDLALSATLAELMARYPLRRFPTHYERTLSVVVDRPRAGFSAWYEMFPRSCSPEPGQHGTFRDCQERLPRIARMGFDVLYLPPIHPIGRTRRKGRGNLPAAESTDPGSPWAIGAAEGGHKAVHPDLGTLDDFRALAGTAAEHGVEIALDIAFQCSPDHPYVQEHPEWFRWRPDGTVQYAENPPKKYQDIYPFDFECDAWRSLWEELKSVVLFWIEQGVRIFRVDNPHTKPLRFWQWLIGEVRRDYPETIFLAEAFTRPRVMYFLAKAGFTQSYTYFSWRNTKQELTRYLTELTQTEVREFFRPNLWPNTPDILPEYLQFGGRPAFMARLVLAATLGANYGVYGPPFERFIGMAHTPGSEEYHESEKYELRHWNLDTPGGLQKYMRRVNQIRREHPALHDDWNLRFHTVDNEQIIAYSKQTDDGRDTVLVVVNLDPHHTQSGWLELPLEQLDMTEDTPFQVHDLLGDGRYLWHGARNYVELNPEMSPAQIFAIRRRVRTEQQFEYFM